MKSQKLSKGVLKEIVKECLIEILAEGLVSKNKYDDKSVKTLKENMLDASRAKSSKKRPSYLDSINFEKRGGEKVKNKKLDEIASSVTKDPILSEMLMDTAHTTLQEQIAAEGSKQFVGSGQGDKAQKVVEANNPEDLFGGEAANKWASLAFGN